MSPESLVLQPKVTEVRATEWTKLENDSSTLPVVSGTTHTHRTCTRTLSPTTGPPGLSAGRCPATVYPRPPKPTTSSQVSVCWSCCSSVGQTTLKWYGQGPVRITHAKAFNESAAKPISEPPTSAPPTPRLHLPPIKEANPLTALSLCQFMRLSVLALISFLTCLFASVFFFSFSLLLSLQIHIDIPRTNPLIPLFQQASVQEVRFSPNHYPQSSHTRTHRRVHTHAAPYLDGVFPSLLVLEKLMSANWQNLRKHRIYWQHLH